MAGDSAEAAVYFASPVEFRRWLDRHHETASALWVGFHKVATGRPSMTWPESVAEALCVGWIDGVRKRVDEARYAIRFTPRKPGSHWSAVNVRLMGQLLAEDRVRPAGVRAWEARREDRTAIHSYERHDEAAFDAADERRFRAAKTAWAYWTTCPPGYRKQLTFWVTSAKRPETRAKRLATLIEACGEGRRLR